MSQPPNHAEANSGSTETPDSEANSNEDNVDMSIGSEEKADQYASYADALDDNANPLKTDDAAEDFVDQNLARIAELEAELAKTKDLMMRTVAEAENGRKRALKDREDAGKFAISGFARDLLSVADNLRRALDATPENAAQDEQLSGLINGIAATEKEMLRALEKHGVEKTEPLDEIFDPNFHEVMFETPMAEKPHGTIIQVIESGYILNGRILRPAKVGVAKNESDGNKPHKTDIEV